MATLIARMEDLCFLDEWREEVNYNNETIQGQRQMWNHQGKIHSFIEGHA